MDRGMGWRWSLPGRYRAVPFGHESVPCSVSFRVLCYGEHMAETCCSVDGCTAAASARGLCRLCYEKARRAGTIAALRTLCSVEGCERHAVARGWCEWHYRWWKRTGSPSPKIPTVEQRFLKFLGDISDTTECWIWQGETIAAGYGRFRLGSRKVLAH